MALGAHHREVKQLKGWLRDKDARNDDRVFIVEGPRALLTLMHRGIAPRSVLVDADRDVPPGIGGHVAVAYVAPGVLSSISDTRNSQGIVAVFDRVRPEETLVAVSEARSLVVLPRINDPGNLGTIARSAQAAGFGGIVIGPGSVDPYNPKTVRAGAGAVGSLPILSVEKETELQASLDQVSQRGGLCLGAAASGEIRLEDAPLCTTPLALVIGHETAGIEAIRVDGTVSIPMASGTESLNVAMAATILCFETARRQRELD